MSKASGILMRLCWTLYRYKFAFLCCAIGFSSFGFGASLRLAVASNFITPMTNIAEQFEQQTGHQVSLSFASSGKLFAQIQHGAPYDMFFSADTEKPRQLIDQQLALADSFTLYAYGKLALWSARTLTDSNLDSLLLNAQRIAIANPKLAPYGQAAAQSLRTLKLSDQLSNKLIYGENIGQAFQFTYTGHAELGFVALSQVLSLQQKQGLTDADVLAHTYLIPQTLSGPIPQAGVILLHSPNQQAAQAFMRFIQTSDIQAQVIGYGYQPAPAS